MRQEWFDRAESMFGYPCVTHRDNFNANTNLPAAHERSMFGEGGQIWEWNDEYFSVLLYSWNHSEKVYHKIPSRDILSWVLRLGVSRYRSSQIRLAKEFRLK